jgi:ornithine--oxo-acid transaminase
MKASALCSLMLFIADEVQTGIVRTGRLLATCGVFCTNGCENKPEVKADILILGKQFQVEFTQFQLY